MTNSELDRFTVHPGMLDLREIFLLSDDDKSGSLSWAEFERHLTDQEVGWSIVIISSVYLRCHLKSRRRRNRDTTVNIGGWTTPSSSKFWTTSVSCPFGCKWGPRQPLIDKPLVDQPLVDQRLVDQRLVDQRLVDQRPLMDM